MTQSELPEGWTNWNTLSLDQLADHLEKEFMISSTGTAKAVNELVKFYRNRESLLEERAVEFGTWLSKEDEELSFNEYSKQYTSKWYDTFINIKEQK